MSPEDAGKKIAETLECYLNNELYKKFTGQITFTVNCNQGGISNMGIETKGGLK